MTTPTHPSLAEALAQFIAGSGLVQLRGAADWLLAGGTAAEGADVAARIEAALQTAIRSLPAALDALEALARRAFLVSNTDMLDEVAVDGWELLLLRDLAEDLREAGLTIIGPAERDAIETFDVALDGAEPWLVELDDARAAEAEERRTAGLTERRWWRPERPPLEEPVAVALPPEVARSLFKPTPAEIDAWRRGELGGELARIVERYTTTGRVLADGPALNVIHLPVGGAPVGRGPVLDRDRLAAVAEDDPAPAPCPPAAARIELDADGEVQIGPWTADTVILSVIVRVDDAFAVSLTSRQGMPIAVDGDRVGRRWWAEVHHDRLRGARLRITWGGEVREVEIDGE